MQLDPMIAQVLEMSKGGPQTHQLPVDEARAAMEQRVEMLKPLAPQHVETTDISLPTPAGPLPARIYRAPGASGPLPLIVWLHGGGWVLGSIESHDNVCRFLADRGPLIVLSVGYRLAPEARAPSQQADVAAALAWAASEAASLGADPTRIIIGGDSAGGNLAALGALEARSVGPKLAGQLLVYPVTDFPADAYESYAENADYGLDRQVMEWFWAHWLADGAGPDATTAPMRAGDLSGLVVLDEAFGQAGMGMSYELDAIAAAVIGGTSLAGGVGRITGTVIGALILGVMASGFTFVGVDAYIQDIIKGLIIVVAVVIDQYRNKRKLKR